MDPRVSTYAKRFGALVVLDVAAHLTPETMHLWAPLDFGAALAYGQMLWVWKRGGRVAITGG